MPYSGRATKTGNSRGFRFESALFVSHPEFESGDVEADVIAPGRLLVRTRVENAPSEADPIFDAFLAFLAEQMRTHPEDIEALTRQDVESLDELLAGVEYDPAEEIPEEFELP
jgi:hypothetical protein